MDAGQVARNQPRWSGERCAALLTIVLVTLGSVALRSITLGSIILGSACLAAAAERPTIWTEGELYAGEPGTLSIGNPASEAGALLVMAQGHVSSYRVPAVPHYHITDKVPTDPGARLLCQFFTWSFERQSVVASNQLALEISRHPGEGRFGVDVDLAPLVALGETSGWGATALVRVPVFLSREDGIYVNNQGLANLRATMLTPDGPHILAQQFNVSQVFSRDDPEHRRAQVAHGLLVLDQVDGSENARYRIHVETADEFTGGRDVLAQLTDDGVRVGTGRAQFDIQARPDTGFRLAGVTVGGVPLLARGGEGAHITMLRRDFMTATDSVQLVSTAGPASAEIVKNGAACAEVLVRGELKPRGVPQALPQRYLLLLRFYAGSAVMSGELMLTNWASTANGMPANYTIPYDGFDFELALDHPGGGAAEVRTLLDDGSEAVYELAAGGNLGVTCGYRAPRHWAEYVGYPDGNYWPENERTGWQDGPILRTEGYQILLDGNPDPRYADRFGNRYRYPRGCVAYLVPGAHKVAVMSGVLPEYSQPVGIRTAVEASAVKVEIRLTDQAAPNAGAKSIPFRAALRKSFTVDFDYAERQGLANFARHHQGPYLGIYNDPSDYSNRLLRFEMVSEGELNELWRRLGFLRQGDRYDFGDRDLQHFSQTFFVGSNRTGGFANWDQAYLELMLGLQGFMGHLKVLRGELDFHTNLGRRQFEDQDYWLEAANPDVPASRVWEVDIEHEDHKGFHLGVSFFGNPLDQIASARMAYETGSIWGVGHTLWIRAIGNRIGRISEEQWLLRSLTVPQRLPGHEWPVEDEILVNGLMFWEDFNSRRVEGDDLCSAPGWTVDPGVLPLFTGDPQETDYPTASWGTPYRYPWVSSKGWFKVIDTFHLVKGLASLREFMPQPAEFPPDSAGRVAAMIDDAELRLAQGGMTLAQWYSFLRLCPNYSPACETHPGLAPWERVYRQRKYYWSCMSTCDERLPDESTNWMGYSFMDAYVAAARQYLRYGERESAFYMLRAALNHLSTQRWSVGGGSPCDEPPDSKQTDFFWSASYPGEMSLWKMIRDEGFLPDFESAYPNLFPMQKRYSGW
ncbi:MAG: hypothetical protein AB1486_30480 [Planctomycetota bacterium]